MSREGLHALRAVVRTRPGADGVTEAWMVPPRRVPAREGGHDRDRLIARWRQRPSRRDGVTVGEVLEQEMPSKAVLVEMSVEAAGHETRRHARRQLRVIGHFLPAAIGKLLGERCVCRLQDQRLRRAAGFTDIAQAKPGDM